MPLLFPKPKQYVVLDWSNFVYRAFFSINTYKMLESLGKTERRETLLKNEPKVLELLLSMVARRMKTDPYRVFIVGEGDGKKRRQQLFPPYKAQRSDDQDVSPIEGLTATSLAMLATTRCVTAYAPAGEADDAIASIVKQLDPGVQIQIVSEDRDLWQLISGDRVVVQTRKLGRVNAAVCKKELGVSPSHVACLKTYKGDTSDNIPRGVPRMRTEHILKLAALDVHPWRAYEKAVAEEVLTERVLSRVVKYKEQLATNYRIMRLAGDVEVMQIQPQAGRTLQQYIEEFKLDVDRDTVQQLTGHGTR